MKVCAQLLRLTGEPLALTPFRVGAATLLHALDETAEALLVKRAAYGRGNATAYEACGTGRAVAVSRPFLQLP